jgi:hypothetical protein
LLNLKNKPFHFPPVGIDDGELKQLRAQVSILFKFVILNAAKDLLCFIPLGSPVDA